MPSRSDVNNYESIIVVNPRAHTITDAKIICDMSNRSRQRRTRFTSGSNIDHVNANDDNSLHRGKRGHNQCAQRHSKDSNDQHTSLPSSPNSSLLDSASLLFRNADITLSGFVSQKENPADRSDAVDDENSFVSSVFSEKLVQPDLNLETEPSSTNENESAKELLDADSNNGIHSKNNMDGILMQDEQMPLTPIATNTDDAGSSEGEDESESRESNLLQTTSSMRLKNEISSENIVQPDLNMDDCEPLKNLYPNSSRVSVFESVSSKSISPCDSSKLHANSKSIDWHLPAAIFHNANLSSDKKHDYHHHDHIFRCEHASINCPTSAVYISTASKSSTTNSSTSSNVVAKNSAPQVDFRLNLTNFSTDVSYDLNTTNSEPIQSISRTHSLITSCSDSSLEPDTLCRENCYSNGVTVVDKSHRTASERNNTSVSSAEDRSDSVVTEERHNYPLRSRLRQELRRMKWRNMQLAPKSFEQLPTEIVFRIVHYLSVQDVFRLQRLNSRFKCIIEQYLLLVKRINFSNGLPFAFLPESITDAALKRALSRTPKVTHILGFYPRKIMESYSSDNHYSTTTATGTNSNNALTYDGIIAAFRLCPKLRSVELMDVELMSELVRYFPRIKFHGMFRNRPDSWDCEYAVPLPPENNPRGSSGGRTDLHHKDITQQSGSSSSSLNKQDGTMLDHPQHQHQHHHRSKPLFGSYISTLFCSVTAATAAANSRPKRKAHSRATQSDDSKRLKKDNAQSLNIPFSLTSRLDSPSSSSSNSFTQTAAVFAHKFALKCSNLANWFEPVGELPLGQGTPSTVPHFLPSRLFTAFNGSLNFANLHDNIDMNSIPSILQDYNANALESLRNMAIAHFLQPGLPSIEAELIAVAPFGYSRRIFHGLGSDRGVVRNNNHGPVLAFAFGAIFVPPHIAAPYIPPVPAVPNNPSNYRALDARQYNAAVSGPHFVRSAQAGGQQYQFAYDRAFNAGQNAGGNPVIRQVPPPQPQDAVSAARNQQRQSSYHQLRYQNNTQLNANGPWLVSPLPCHLQWIILPHAITNLTKLDLVSVAISAIPRLDNIKYLHLKWVVFSSNDPFYSFAAPKLQSFVMNNCSIPSRVVRFVRIFSALSRAPQLMRLEMVGTRFIDGLIGHIVDDTMAPGRGFRNLQRLVLSNNKDANELDIGLLLLVAQQSLSQVSLQMLHTKNSLFEALHHSGAKFLRLESLVLGYLDPYQSRLTVSELMSLGIGESSDHLTPICTITDWGLAFVFELCPRLVNLTIRNAPYLVDITKWFSKPRSQTDTTPTSASTENRDECDDNNAVDDDDDDDDDVVVESDAGPLPLVDNSVSESNSRSCQDAVNPTVQSEDNADCCILSCPVNNGFSTAHFTSLRSLTLENCPAISVGNLEHILSTGLPFPCLETLVLRNLFAPIQSNSSSLSSKTDFLTNNTDNVDWRRLNHLLNLSDLLAARRIGYSSLSPEGVGLSCSVREVTHASPSRGGAAGGGGVLPDTLRTKSFDLFYSVRAHTYLNQLLEMDGSLSSNDRILKTLFADISSLVNSSSHQQQHYQSHSNGQQSVDFVSQSTQTCLCGLLEWDLVLRMCQPIFTTTNNNNSNNGDFIPCNPSCSSANCSKAFPPTAGTSSSPTSSNEHPRYNTFSQSVSNSHLPPVSMPGQQPQLQLGGPLAFHPFPPTVQHMMLCKLVTASEWTRLFNRSQVALNLPFGGPIVSALSSGECPGCASSPERYSTGFSYVSISSPLKEFNISHQRRKWVARDASVDTSELRCYALTSPQILNINQPLNAPYSNLTSLHFEKVGISHLIISESHHLKNITLENCTELRAILFKSKTGDINGDQIVTRDVVPALRRIRIINCAKFAIYNFLHEISRLYPLHDENLSITYRPFGEYDSQVERALWEYCQHAHILISHDYRLDTSERVMEEFHSTFDQLFREVINFVDMLIRRDLLTVHPQPNTFLQNRFHRRTEHGSGWDLITDNPWIHEVCCSLLLLRQVEVLQHRSDQVDQFYELLSEFQGKMKQMKIQRHGIHYHVQYRNVHNCCCTNDNTTPGVDSSNNFPIKFNTSQHSYLNWPYTEKLLCSTKPMHDPNAWLHLVPKQQQQNNNCSSQSIQSDDALCNLPVWQRLLLSQEEAVPTPISLMMTTTAQSTYTEQCLLKSTKTVHQKNRSLPSEIHKHHQQQQHSSAFEQKRPRLCTQKGGGVNYSPKLMMTTTTNGNVKSSRLTEQWNNRTSLSEEKSSSPPSSLVDNVDGSAGVVVDQNNNCHSTATNTHQLTPMAVKRTLSTHPTTELPKAKRPKQKH